MVESRALADFERSAFQSLNAVVEPLVRAGLGGPLLSPFGLIVLETRGRTSGRLRRTPLLAATFPGATIVSTFRGKRSGWVKNLGSVEEATWWVNGARREGRSVVFAPDLAWPTEEVVPAPLRSCAATVWRPLVTGGWAIAVLVES